MKAILIRKYGGPEVLEIADVDAPKVTPGHILIKVEAGGINPIDWKIRSGEAKMFVRAPLPITLGCEVAGEVIGTGPGVTRFKQGDRVMSCVEGDHGGFAEQIVVAEHMAAVRPQNIDAPTGAAVLVGAVTSLQALRNKGELKAGQRVLVNGASGAVGSFAVQVGKLLGGHVTAVCSEAKFDLVKKLGADECIDYAKSDFTKMDKTWDVIFDAAGKRHFGDCRTALTPHGHYITTISSGGDMVAPVLNPIRSQKSHFIIMKPNVADLDYVRGLIEAGTLKALVGAVFPMEKIADAQALAQSGKATGKVVVTFV